jgi:hypothetical protein
LPKQRQTGPKLEIIGAASLNAAVSKVIKPSRLALRTGAAPSEEVGSPHPSLDRAEGMLDRLTPLTHFLRMLIKPALHGLENMLMLPS